MNILIPHHWLLDYLTTEATPTQLQKHLSLSGPSVERIYEREGDSVYDIEVTTNRVDAMSVRGIAREAAVILSNAGWPSQLIPLKLTEPKVKGTTLPLPAINDPNQLCQRILAVVLDGVRHGESPAWLQTRLRQVDLNPKDVVIDITNAVAHELGHPCHAFDYDKIMALGGEINIAQADAGMLFTTLDGEQYTTVGGEVVFLNPAGVIIDLPGIMGTLNTAVDDQTKRVLLWVESIAADKIRFASMTHNIRTPAAQLNERDLDHNLGREVLLRATGLYQELAGARVASPMFDLTTDQRAPQPIFLSGMEIQRYLGLSLPNKQVTSILEQLDCQVETTADGWSVTPPSFRTDLAIPADLVEEVARIYGYHNLPSRILATEIPTSYPTDTNFAAEELIMQALADLGYQEQITYSLVTTPDSTTPHLQLKNALTQDKEVLRRSLLPSHLGEIAQQWQNTPLRGTFELANIYPPRKGALPDEHLVLTLTGRSVSELRSSLEVLANRLFIDSNSLIFRVKNHKKYEYIQSIFESSALITHHDRVLGVIGWLTPHLAGLEIEWRELLAIAKRWPEYHPLPRTSAMSEDWTVAIPPDTPVDDIRQALLQADPRILTVTLTGQYQHNWTFQVQLLDRQQQLDAPTAQAIRQKVAQQLQPLAAHLV